MKSTVKKKKSEQRHSEQLEEAQRMTEVKKCRNLGKARGIKQDIRLQSNGLPRYQDKSDAKRSSQVIITSLKKWNFFLINICLLAT